MHPEIVEGDGGAGKDRREGKGFVSGEVSFLQADDIRRGEQIADAGGDKVAAVGKVERGAIVGETVNIVRNNTRNGEGKVGEKEERGGRARRLKRITKHGQWRKKGNKM